jgi:hypothetical protein
LAPSNPSLARSSYSKAKYWGEVDRLQRRRARDVDDEYRGPRDLGQPYRPVRRLGLDGLGTGEGVEAGGGIAAREGLLLQLGDGVAVLGVHHYEDSGVPGELQCLEEVFVLGVEVCSLVGHEDLDGGNASCGEVGQLRLYVVAQVRYGDVEAVVDDSLVSGFLRPRIERPGEGAAGLLQGEVDDHGRPAGGRGLGTRGPVISRDGTAKGHVHMGVGVDKTRHDEFARGVHALGAFGAEVRAEGDYLLVLDEYVSPVSPFRGYDRSATKEQLSQSPYSFPQARAGVPPATL